MVHGRLLVSAWECGLRDVNDSAVKLVMQAVEVFIRPPDKSADQKKIFFLISQPKHML